MVTVNENIRFYKPNDPYFYEVDNLPLIDLLENDKTLAAAINDILLSQSNFATEGYVQDAIGDVNQIDINGDNITLPNNVIDWVLQQGYGQGTLESLTDTDLTGISDGDTLVFDSGTFVPGKATSDIVYFTEPLYFMNEMEYGVDITTGELLGRPGGVGLQSSPAPLKGEKHDQLGSFKFGESSDLFAGNSGRLGVYRMYNVMNNSSFNGVNLRDQGLFKFRRTFAECGLPPETTSIFMAAFVNDVAKSTSADRSSRVIFRNLPPATNSFGTSYPGNCLVHCYSDGQANSTFQASHFQPVQEYYLGENQIVNQTVEFEFRTTSLNVQEVNPQLKNRPGFSLVIIGYKVG
tara:strand:+ start:436 stop:1482 length:1047 start_codon:yes stop_codon:yes gene_type:complete